MKCQDVKIDNMNSGQKISKILTDIAGSDISDLIICFTFDFTDLCEYNLYKQLNLMLIEKQNMIYFDEIISALFEQYSCSSDCIDTIRILIRHKKSPIQWKLPWLYIKKPLKENFGDNVSETKNYKLVMLLLKEIKNQNIEFFESDDMLKKMLGYGREYRFVSDTIHLHMTTDIMQLILNITMQRTEPHWEDLAIQTCKAACWSCTEFIINTARNREIVIDYDLCLSYWKDINNKYFVDFMKSKIKNEHIMEPTWNEIICSNREDLSKNYIEILIKKGVKQSYETK